MSTLPNMYWSFLDIYLFFHMFFSFFDAAQIRYIFRLLLSNDFEQFGSLHMCAPRKVYRPQLRTVPPGSEPTTLPKNDIHVLWVLMGFSAANKL